MSLDGMMIISAQAEGLPVPFSAYRGFHGTEPFGRGHADALGSG